MSPRHNLPKLPQLLNRKLYKTGQTRGADDDEIFQNRVLRSSTVLIPYSVWMQCQTMPPGEDRFENGFIALIPPARYFGDAGIKAELRERDLIIGQNAVVFYETRGQWIANDPETLGWQPAHSRIAPLGGEYIARISATTATENGGKIIRGFSSSANKGAGIRVYEYASTATTTKCRNQLEALVWLCSDSEAVLTHYGMTPSDIAIRKSTNFNTCKVQGLLDIGKLTKARALNNNGKTICPLCLDELSAQGFFSHMEQAEGREVLDLTITQLNLFHIEELRIGVFNHLPYNLGWGHHHCNIVVKDSGITRTLEWMDTVLQRNIEAGYSVNANKGN